MMKPKLIKTETEYEAALARVDTLMSACPGTEDGDALELWVNLIQAYEEEHYPIPTPDPVEAIRFRMEQQNLKPADLVPYLGSKSKVSEVLSGKRSLSMTMIRKLRQGLGIPAESLLGELKRRPSQPVAQRKCRVLQARTPLGLALSEYRQAKGWGINELARVAHVDPAQVSRLEGAHQVSAHASTLRKLAAALEVDVDHLLRLNEISRRYQWRTDRPDPVIAEAAAKYGVPCDIETAIKADDSIPAKRKKWLIECVALARK